jgi:peroxiredoxin
MTQTTGARFEILSDADRKTIVNYGILNAEERGGIAKPATFIVDKEGRIRFVYVGKDGGDRPEDSLILAEVEKLARTPR